jgi:hypothetical protein
MKHQNVSDPKFNVSEKLTFTGIWDLKVMAMNEWKFFFLKKKKNLTLLI